MKSKTHLYIEFHFLAAILLILLLLITSPTQSTLSVSIASGIKAAVLWIMVFCGFGYSLYLSGKHLLPKRNG